MKANFSKQTILGIVLEVRRYGELYVAQDGSMFRTVDSAESTLRTKNMIIGEAEDYLGYVKLTKEMVSDARLAVFAKNLNEFNKLFADVKIPRMRSNENTPKGRQYASKQTTDAAEVSKLEALLGMAGQPVKEEVKPTEVENEDKE
jgi:hypothetical protein